jgi:hypothetical protein
MRRAISDREWVMLPTKDITHIDLVDKLYYVSDLRYIDKKEPNCQHLYLISDDKIRENDWYFDSLQNTIRFGCNNCAPKGYKKKIIATTDPNMGKTSAGGAINALQLPQIQKSFLKYFVENKDNLGCLWLEFEPICYECLDLTGPVSLSCPNSNCHDNYMEIPEVNDDNEITIVLPSIEKQLLNKQLK